MRSQFKAKTFQSRMKHRGCGKAMGEKGVKKGVHGASAGEVAMGRAKMRKDLPLKRSPYAGGNGGK